MPDTPEEQGNEPEEEGKYLALSYLLSPTLFSVTLIISSVSDTKPILDHLNLHTLCSSILNQLLRSLSTLQLLQSPQPLTILVLQLLVLLLADLILYLETMSRTVV